MWIGRHVNLLGQSVLLVIHKAGQVLKHQNKPDWQGSEATTGCERFTLYLPATLGHMEDICNEYCVMAELFVGPYSDAFAARPSRGELAG